MRLGDRNRCRGSNQRQHLIVFNSLQSLSGSSTHNIQLKKKVVNTHIRFELTKQTTETVRQLDENARTF